MSGRAVLRGGSVVTPAGAVRFDVAGRGLLPGRGLRRGGA
jgi:hypothetical protein